MPLQQINVSPAESSKNATYSDQQVCQSGGVEFTGRSESQMSSESSGSTGVEICRICHCEGDAEAGLIAPCYCAGSLRYVHQICLQQWIKSSNTRCCELCRFQFIMHTKTKPFTEWEPLEMNGFERRKLVCAVMFHAIALTCVVWSLYVLIDRTAEEIKQGLLEWPFWTKLIVVAIGFTGGVVFMYIQCKAYMQICQRWKAYNRVIYVQNAPEKQPLSMSRVSTAQASKQSSSDYHGAEIGRTNLDQPHKPYTDSGGSNGKDETSIDLKGVRNVHIFFKDENQVTVQNGVDGGEEVGAGCGGQEGSIGCTSRGATRLDPDQTPAMWHIKIGKGVSNDSSSSLRCNEAESREGEARSGSEVKDEGHQVVAGRSDRDVCDPVLKLQINKAEIVIKFGQGEVSSEETNDKNSSSKDTSVNIKIDDKESEPIVIDLVKKAPVEQPKIRFDFSERANSEAEDSKTLDEASSRQETGENGSKLHERVREALYSDLLDRCAESTANDSYPSGTDSGSQSPLLLPKNLE